MSNEKRPVPARFVGKGFKPGQSGNPGGRAKGFERRIRECVDAMKADDPMPDPEAPDGAQIPAFEAIVKRAVLDAISGDRYARDFVADRLMGKPKQTVEISDAESMPSTDWSVVPEEKRRELLQVLELVSPGDGIDTEH